MAKTCNRCGTGLVNKEVYYCEECRQIVRQEFLSKENSSEGSNNENRSSDSLSVHTITVKSIKSYIPILIGLVNWIIVITCFNFITGDYDYRRFPFINKIIEAYFLLSIIPSIYGIIRTRNLQSSWQKNVSYLVHIFYILVFGAFALFALIMGPHAT